MTTFFFFDLLISQWNNNGGVEIIYSFLFKNIVLPAQDELFFFFFRGISILGFKYSCEYS